MNDPDRGIPYRDEPLSSLVERLVGGGDVDGYAMVLLADHLTELLADVDVPAFAPSAGWSMYKLWLSAAATRSPLHMDLPDNCFCQFVGTKDVRLFAPSEELRMYRHRPWSRLPQVSRVDAAAPDLDRFPRFAAARSMSCTVGPGDLLYIPRFWWHQVQSRDFSISVNYWWSSGWMTMMIKGALAYQRLRELKF